MLVKCKHCGNDFQSYLSRLNKGKGKYCTPKCCSDHRKQPDVERFWSHVNKTEGCWLWTGFTTNYGYGVAWFDGESEFAHRIACRLANGPIPPGMFVLHKCDIPGCVNPDHLYVGTAKDNSTDMVNRGRAARGDRNGARLYPDRQPRGNKHWSHVYPERIPKGERHPNAKLTEKMVLDIREMHHSGMARQQIANLMGITRQAVRLIVLRINWRHLAEMEREVGIGAAVSSEGR